MKNKEYKKEIISGYHNKLPFFIPNTFNKILKTNNA
jgi:hypothetical protein